MRSPLFFAVLTLAASLCSASAEQGVTANEVAFAQVAAMAGPAAALGTGMNLGIRAAFEEANRAGGVNGRKLRLDAVDDGYEPETSVEKTRTVIAGNAHIALIGAVGTPTSLATQPLATEAGLPFIGPFTGAAFLRDPKLHNVFNLRSSYNAETEMWMRYLVDRQGLKKIGILYQDDSFGRAGLAGVEAALSRRGMALAARGAYVRNTLAVKTALLDIRRAGAEAVVMVGAYKPMAEFIRVAHKIGYTPEFVNISFVGTDALVTELGPGGAGVIISQVVPYPFDSTQPVVARYTRALKAVAPEAPPSFISLEGYLVGRLAIAGLQAAGPGLTRESYLAALQHLGTVDLDGLKLKFGPGDNQGLDEVFLTVISAAGAITELGPEPNAGSGPELCPEPSAGG
jgi:ABC-type branched-subunit amino acid transport system substrate-binding protein